MTTKDTTNLVGIDTNFGENADGLFRKHSQNISQAFMDDVRDARNASANEPIGNFQRVASIPTIVIEKWMREGFNIYDPNVNGKDIIKRLKAENLDGFLTTDKSI